MSAARIGVFVCACGPNIADRVDIEAVAEEISHMKGVVVSQTYGLLCSPAGRQHLVDRITENNLDRIVIAACSPREHGRTFSEVCIKAGINPFMLEMANIREHVAWVTPDRTAATLKAIRLIRGAVSRIRRHRPLESRSIDADPAVLVIGGGLAGMSAALMLSESGRSVTIMEKESALGGHPREGEEQLISILLNQMESSPGITSLTETIPGEIVGFLGGFVTTPERESTIDPDDILSGAVVLATGCLDEPSAPPRPAADFAELAEMLRVETDERGFPVKKHGSLDPVSTPIDGIFVAGRAGGPCTTEESLATAEAVAGAILAAIIPGRQIETEPKTALISPTLCAGCRTCMSVCGYGAIAFNEETLICRVSSVLCKGCGNCAASCPSGAIRSEHFLPDQIRCQLSELLS